MHCPFPPTPTDTNAARLDSTLLHEPHHTRGLPTASSPVLTRTLVSTLKTSLHLSPFYSHPLFQNCMSSHLNCFNNVLTLFSFILFAPDSCCPPCPINLSVLCQSECHLATEKPLVTWESKGIWHQTDQGFLAELQFLCL